MISLRYYQHHRFAEVDAIGICSLASIITLSTILSAVRRCWVELSNKWYPELDGSQSSLVEPSEYVNCRRRLRRRNRKTKAIVTEIKISMSPRTSIVVTMPPRIVRLLFIEFVWDIDSVHVVCLV